MDIEEVLDEIIKLPEDLHGAGTVSKKVLQGIYRYCSAIEIKNSVETGSGKTTLLFSHLSKHHTVFSLDLGGSIQVVKKSPLLNKTSYNLIEGPTQKTLPAYKFTNKIQVAYIDGPHAYPFPELEYFYLYPHLDHNALLILDDILIPTLHNLYKFIREDEMFELLEVIDTTAFFRRTSKETFDPYREGWWIQNYNKNRYPIFVNTKVLLKSFLPEPIKVRLKKILKYRKSSFSNLI